MSRHPFAFRVLPLAAALLWAGCKADQKKTDGVKTKEGAQTSTKAEVELPPGDGPVATVNSVPIPRAPFNKEFKATIERYQKAHHDVQPALRERLKDNIVRRLIDTEIIRQESEKLGVVIDPKDREEQWQAHKKRYGTEEAFKTFLERAGTTEADVREQFDANLLREKVFGKVSDQVAVTPEEVKDFFDKNQVRYDEPEQVQASHILIRIPPGATDADKAAKKKRAEEVLKKAKAKGADFAALAKEYGEDPTKDHGGDLGFFTKGRMVKPFEDAVWTMKKGQISGIVETQFGYHIIKKVDFKAERKKPFKEVEDQIQKSLLAKKRNEAIRDALQKWKNEAKLEIFVKGDEAIMAAGQPAMPPTPTPLPRPGMPTPTEMLKLQKAPHPDLRDAPPSPPPNTNAQPVQH
jgi:peptidyl-prolyl cis-trans isomerase C